MDVNSTQDKATARNRLLTTAFCVVSAVGSFLMTVSLTIPRDSIENYQSIFLLGGIGLIFNLLAVLTLGFMLFKGRFNKEAGENPINQNK